MSGRLVSQVFESALTHRLKSLAAVLASFGRDDGSSIRPAVVRVARLWGRSERRTLAGLADLQRLGVLVVVRPHAPQRPTEYRIDAAQLAALVPSRTAWTRRSGQLVLTFPQTFAQPAVRLAGLSEDFHRRAQVTPDDRGATPDTSVTRSVQEIRRDTSTSRARETMSGAVRRKAPR
jgi:hypothetical protein